MQSVLFIDVTTGTIGAAAAANVAEYRYDSTCAGTLFSSVSQHLLYLSHEYRTMRNLGISNAAHQARDRRTGMVGMGEGSTIKLHVYPWNNVQNLGKAA
ncbi:hypothetical protein F5Y19DRAFT_419486 [Xylariaceae sp. FL1651]|nr:hypothetical protein F5Y19DRAFT_419486 [Xylariaceae sp. FL1651]